MKVGTQLVQRSHTGLSCVGRGTRGDAAGSGKYGQGLVQRWWYYQCVDCYLMCMVGGNADFRISTHDAQLVPI